MISELELDRAFANKVESSVEFQRWILDKTKFCNESSRLRLLNKEQEKLKPRKKPENWWRSWWCRLDDGSESETDIFLVFERNENKQRIALHIEDKPPYGKFTQNQYLNYKKRAEFMKCKNEYMNYVDYTTILISPLNFVAGNKDKVANFDLIISYEEISEHIKLFGDSIGHV